MQPSASAGLVLPVLNIGHAFEVGVLSPQNSGMTSSGRQNDAVGER